MISPGATSHFVQPFAIGKCHSALVLSIVLLLASHQILAVHSLSSSPSQVYADQEGSLHFVPGSNGAGEGGRVYLNDMDVMATLNALNKTLASFKQYEEHERQECNATTVANLKSQIATLVTKAALLQTQVDRLDPPPPPASSLPVLQLYDSSVSWVNGYYAVSGEEGGYPRYARLRPDGSGFASVGGQRTWIWHKPNYVTPTGNVANPVWFIGRKGYDPKNDITPRSYTVGPGRGSLRTVTSLEYMYITPTEGSGRGLPMFAPKIRWL